VTVQRIEIEPHDTPSARLIRQAVELLHEGAVAAYPTDTVYALGCTIESKRAAERIYKARQMAAKHRLALLCPDLSSAASYAHFSQGAFRLARQIFPGPYTLILPATREVPRQLWETKRRRVVGLRIPSHPVTLALLRELGRPLLTTSAIPDGEDEPCTDADELTEAFGHHLDLLIDSGEIHGEPSTVLELDADDDVIVIREGAGTLDGVVD
jgi:tRNA threonylcarbamoyl adenosine modification protein (Sua5/YciO/YrdC/YwlC family)